MIFQLVFKAHFHSLFLVFPCDVETILTNQKEWLLSRDEPKTGLLSLPLNTQIKVPSPLNQPKGFSPTAKTTSS